MKKLILMWSIFAAAIVGLVALNIAAFSSGPSEPAPSATSSAPESVVLVPVLVPTQEELTAQVEHDLPLVVADKLGRANKSLREFQSRFPDCTWATQQGLAPDPRSAGAQMDATIALLKTVAPYPPVFGSAVVVDPKAPKLADTYWVILAASCGRTAG